MHIARDVAGGLILVAIGAAFYFGASKFRIGTIVNMGPGYFPSVVAVLLILIGIAVVIMGLINAEKIPVPEWRPTVAVLAGIGAFALTVRQVGLIPAMALGVLIASAGDATSKFWQSLLLAIGAGIGAWLIFRVGLGLQLPGVRVPAWWR
jgi:hypothetical protein